MTEAFIRTGILGLLALSCGFCQIGLPSQPGSIAGPSSGVSVSDEPPGGLRPPQPPALSPARKTSLTINGRKITITYSAPSMRKRAIFGALVPWDQVWRAGANDATMLHASADLQLPGLLIPRGDHSLFVWPDPKQWLLIISKETGQSGLDYHQDRDLGRIPMQVSPAAKPVETYKMALTKVGPSQGRLELSWETTVASVDFEVRAPR